MKEISVTEDLWASRMLPEGLVERWFVPDGAYVGSGDRVAEIRVEGALHEIMAPAAGHLRIAVAVNSVVEPGTVIGRINP